MHFLPGSLFSTAFQFIHWKDYGVLLQELDAYPPCMGYSPTKMLSIVMAMVYKYTRVPVCACVTV